MSIIGPTTMANLAIQVMIFRYTPVLLNKYDLHNTEKPKKITNLSVPPTLVRKFNEVDIRKFPSKFQEAITNFEKVLKENFDEKDLTNFYNNINTVKIKEKKYYLHNLSSNEHTIGSYDLRTNKIDYIPGGKSTPIYHELFHMASATKQNKTSYCGFEQDALRKKLSKFGVGLNEGYTQYLAKTYFKDYSNCYSYEVEYAEAVERIVGKEKMHELYLNSNLIGLIKELGKYASEDDVLTFISNLDYLSKIRESQRVSKSMKTKIVKRVIQNELFLKKAFKEKYKETNSMSADIKELFFESNLNMIRGDIHFSYNVKLIGKDLSEKQLAK